jgi:hypothetical protein
MQTTKSEAARAIAESRLRSDSMAHAQFSAPVASRDSAARVAAASAESELDVVTGDAPAVHGPDAFTGVFDFVVDRDFTGIEVDLRGGIASEAKGGVR